MQKKSMKKIEYKPLLILEEPVTITLKELEIIKQCGGIKDQKLLFTLLCFSKASTSTNNWVTTSARILFRSAGINISGIEQDKMIYNLKCNGYLVNSKRLLKNNVLVHVEVPEEERDQDQDIIVVNDLRALGVVYLAYIGGQYMKNRMLKKCKGCSIPFLDGTKKKNQMYCSECRNTKYIKIQSDETEKSKSSENGLE